MRNAKHLLAFIELSPLHQMLRSHSYVDDFLSPQWDTKSRVTSFQATRLSLEPSQALPLAIGVALFK
jgi:hypothetical protein